MARTTKAKTIQENKNTKEEVSSQIKETSVPKVKTKSFGQEDGILCKSVAPGATYVKGIKSGEIYTFEAQGAEEYIEYRDLVAAVRSGSSILFKPFILVEDEDFINEQNKLKKFYNSMYTPQDYNDFFRAKPAVMKRLLEQMPVGIKETIKSMAATRIKDGSLDSVSKIKALDEYFGTQLMLLTGLYGEE